MLIMRLRRGFQAALVAVAALVMTVSARADFLSMPTSDAVCMARLSGLEAMTSKWTFRALRQLATRMHCCLPSLSSGRLASRVGFLRGVPAFAWRRTYKFMVLSSFSRGRD